MMEFLEYAKKRSLSLFESEDLKQKREDLEKAKSKTKQIERELELQKLDEKYLRALYQHECPHIKLTKSKKDSNESNNHFYNDYFAKCENCSAQIYDQSRCLSYINNLNDIILKLPKIIESMKMAKLEVDNELSILEDSHKFIKRLISLRDKLISIDSIEFNNSIKSHIRNYNEKE